jgi:hypothetical protein
MNTLAKHLFSGSNGALYDTRVHNWPAHPLRATYCKTCARIDTTIQLRATLRAGGYAWPGGYQLFFMTADGGALSFAAVLENYAQVSDAVRHNDRNSGWRVLGVCIDEEGDVFCDHTGLPISRV